MSEPLDRHFGYRINKEDVLVEVNQDWLDFARANWKPDFSPAEVLGQRLWSSIADTTTRQLYQMLVKRTRTLRRTLSIPFRCDSPHKRRFMELTIAPLAEDGVEFTGRILREEVRPAVEMLLPDRPRSASLLAMCGWCKQIRVPAWVTAEPWPARVGTWWEVENLGAMLTGLHWEYLPDVTHTICPPCYQRVMQELTVEEGLA